MAGLHASYQLGGEVTLISGVRSNFGSKTGDTRRASLEREKAYWKYKISEPMALAPSANYGGSTSKYIMVRGKQSLSISLIPNCVRIETDDEMLLQYSINENKHFEP